MKYRAKENKKVVVEVIEDNGEYIKFLLNNIEISVAAKRFFKIYEPIEDELCKQKNTAS